MDSPLEEWYSHDWWNTRMFILDGALVTYIYIAAVSGSPAVARVLIKHGAEVNQRDTDGNTPLMVSS